MRRIAELCTGEEAHRSIRGLTLAHLDATLKSDSEARRILDKDLARILTADSINAHLPA